MRMGPGPFPLGDALGEELPPHPQRVLVGCQRRVVVLALQRSVADDVVHALTSKKPKVRYLVGPGPKKASRLARMPVRLRDWLLRRFMISGVAGQAREAEPAKRRFAT